MKNVDLSADVYENTRSRDKKYFRKTAVCPIGARPAKSPAGPLPNRWGDRQGGLTQFERSGAEKDVKNVDWSGDVYENTRSSDKKYFWKTAFCTLCLRQPDLKILISGEV